MAWPSTPLVDPWPALSLNEVAATDMTANITNIFNQLQAAMYGTWTSYTPALTTSGTAATLGTGGTALGRYKVIGGNICHFVAVLNWGTSPTAGTGTYFMSLPVAWINDSIPPQFSVMYTIPATSGTSFTGTPATTTTVAFNRGDATANQLGAAYPSAPTSGRSLQVNGTYRCGT